MLRWTILSLSLSLFTSACALLPQPTVEAPEATAPAGWTVPTTDASIFRVVDAKLELHTYRAGWLSGLAHNHVIETTALNGEIRLAEPITGSTARLFFRPWDLILDDPDSRSSAGAGFESARTEQDISATRTRMLGPRGFNSNAYPFVVVEVRWLDREQIHLTINFRGADYAFRIPISWSQSAHEITASADFEITHSVLGLNPYSAFAGAIAVAEPIRIQLDLSATRAPPL